MGGRDLIGLKRIDAAINMADHYTKPLPHHESSSNDTTTTIWVVCHQHTLENIWSVFMYTLHLERNHLQNKENTQLVQPKRCTLGYDCFIFTWHYILIFPLRDSPDTIMKTMSDHQSVGGLQILSKNK
jgi:hypothetical protein